MNSWSRFFATPPAETPIRMPRPSSLGLPRMYGATRPWCLVRRFWPSAGVCSATISAFIAKPPAAMITEFGLDRTGFGEMPPRNADDGTVLDDEVRYPGLVRTCTPSVVGALDE